MFTNPLKHWMQNKDVMVTFDHLEILKVSDGGEPKRVGDVHGELSWPLFVQLMGGMMQYSAMESGFDKPLHEAGDYEALAKHLAAHKDNAFILRSKNMKLHYTAVKEYTELWAKQANQTIDVTEAVLSMGGMNPFVKAWADTMRSTTKPTQKMVDSIYEITLPEEANLGEAAGTMAQLMQFVGGLQSMGRGAAR